MFFAAIGSVSHLRSLLLARVYLFGETLGDEVEARAPKKLKSLVEVPNVVHVKVHVLSFNMILLSSPWRVPRPSYPFRRNFGRSGKGSFTEKAKIIN